MNKEKRRAIFERFKAQNLNPITELAFKNPFELLIAVILSAQATDVSVNKATATLFKIAPKASDFLKLQVEGLKPYIQSIGLFNTKAKHIIQTCEILVTKYRGEVPESREALEALPGVGRKTANVVLNTAFGHPTIAVDTHIFRVANRTGLGVGKTPLAVENKLLKAIPEPFLKDAHHWLVLHGRYVCTARKPHCKTCLIRDLCEYPDKT